MAAESRKTNDVTDSMNKRDKGETERRKIGIDNTAKRSKKKLDWLEKSGDVKMKAVLNAQARTTKGHGRPTREIR